MKVLLTTLNSKHIHSNLALKYLYAVGVGAMKGAGLNSGSSPLIIRMITYTENCFGAIMTWFAFPAIFGISKESSILWKHIKSKSQHHDTIGRPGSYLRAADIMKKNRSVDFILQGKGKKVSPNSWKR